MKRPILVPVLFVSASCFASADAPQLDYNRDIRPILADNCFHCHGRDEAARKAKLRLDAKDEAVAAGALVPGDATGSELVRRITATDANNLMPPPESKRSLTPEQIEMLARWIDEGAEYKPHWAFIPVDPVTVPGDGVAWSTNPIDNFVYRRLAEEAIEPSPETDKETLIRRVTLGLTGLPPTIEEIDAFLADTSDDAYETVVDRLLASPAYGERMALDWLDVARYADTFGYQNDVESRVWPWRDWVIEAFNANMPYDQFITWQLAGDLIPDATPESTLATAFNRLHRQTNEGGSIPEEFRVEYVADRTRTFGTAFLGMTMECARCHDHKFDPISQKEYYETFAFFDDIDESGLYSHFTTATPTPAMPLMTDADRARQQELSAQLAEAETGVASARDAARERFVAWLMAPDRTVPSVAPVVDLPLDYIVDGKTVNSVKPDRPATVADAIASVPGRFGDAASFSGDHKLEVPGAGQLERTQPFSLSLWVKATEFSEHMILAHCTEASLDAGSRGWELSLEDGRPAFALTHFWPGNAIRVESDETIAAGAWVHLAATYDGSSTAAGVSLYVNGVQARVQVVRDKLSKTILYDSKESQPSLTLAARFRDSGFTNGAIDAFRLYDRALGAIEIRALRDNVPFPDAIAARAADHHADIDEDLFALYLRDVDQPYRDAAATLHAARVAESDFINGIPEIMVMRDMPEPRQAYVLARGAYDAPTDPVEPDTPESIMPFPDDYPRNRLGLAQWVTDPKNPLTARVAANRYWQLFFGRGLVETQEDFGTQGRPPTHPELLDWLAHEFVVSGWDVKALVKLIVMSATYQQSSAPCDGLSERDPANALLARGPHFRLPAEVVRDEALASSGLLVRTIGGPSVKPYQPEGLWRDASQVTYQRDSGDALYRRSMYTYWKRTVPPPTMLTFDAPSREFCQVRREVTATPLQSLILLNDPQYVEAARVLAEQVMREAPEDVEARLTRAFRRLTGRVPDAREREILAVAYEEQAAMYRASADGAVAYVSVGEAVVPDGLDTAAMAATTAAVQLIMNLNEFQMQH